MDYNTRVLGYKGKDEGQFNNYGGGQFNNATGGGFGVLDPNDRTLTITCVNALSTASATPVTLFGSTYDLTGALIPTGVTITVAESSNQIVKTELLQNSFRITGMKYVVTTVAQYSNVLYLYEQHSTGALNRRLWQPLNYRSAQNTLTTQIDAPNFEMLMTAINYIQFTLNGSETVTFTFTLSEKTAMKNILRDKPVTNISDVPAPTGLPQLDTLSNRLRRF
mgnify:FL=1